MRNPNTTSSVTPHPPRGCPATALRRESRRAPQARSGPALRSNRAGAAAALIAAAAALLLSGAAPTWGVTFRWASSSNRIYVTGPGSATLSDIVAVLDKAPLTQTAPGVWLLRANILIESGAELVLHGTRIGGDVDELRLQSNNSSAANSFVWISADWGSIHIQSTTITSWDAAVNGPDTETDTYGRAYIRVRSSLASDGVTAQESRMDIIDSDIGYLGYYASEAYGLVWKVVGKQAGLFDLVNVYGDVQNSRMHHNYFGMYTYGAYGMTIRNNEFDHNVKYGVDPHDDSDYLLIKGNHSHHNGDHGIIISQRCNSVIIRENISESNTGNGIMVHRSSDDGTVENNICQDNTDSGIAIFDSRRTTIRNNLCVGNGKSGMRFSVGCNDNVVENNELADGSQYGFYLYKGNDAPRADDDGRNKRNQFVGNSVHNNGKEGIKLAESDDNTFVENEFAANGPILRFNNSVGNVLDGNAIPSDATVKTEGTSGFAAETVLRDQPSVQINLNSYATVTFEDEKGAIFEPSEQGIVTTVTPTGSRLSLTYADVGSASLVVTRPLLVTPDNGRAFVDPTIWNLSGDLSKRWILQPESGAQSLDYAVGDLAPNTVYNILRAGNLLTQLRSDSSGVIRFTDVPGTTSLVQYDVQPGP
jgi:parallel beta-helix repeat protein